MHLENFSILDLGEACRSLSKSNGFRRPSSKLMADLGLDLLLFQGTDEKTTAFRKRDPSPFWVFHQHPGQKIFGGINSEAV